jgi:hypothetical protein
MEARGNEKEAGGKEEKKIMMTIVPRGDSFLPPCTSKLKTKT